MQKQVTSTTKISRSQPPERQQTNKPTGVLRTTNLGIQSILNPPVKKETTNNQIINGRIETEQIDYNNLLRVWKEYSLKVKRENKNSLHSTLSNSKPKISSDLVISFEISNSIAAKEFDQNINDFTAFLKTKLKNSKLSLNYTIVETEVVKFSDSKTKYENLLKENSSLEKFRKLFNLDIEY